MIDVEFIPTDDLEGMIIEGLAELLGFVLTTYAGAYVIKFPSEELVDAFIRLVERFYADQEVYALDTDARIRDWMESKLRQTAT